MINIKNIDKYSQKYQAENINSSLFFSTLVIKL